MSKEHLDVARLVDLSDEELRKFLAHYYHLGRNLENGKKDDPELARLKGVAKSYEEDNYNEEIRNCKAKIKAARELCRLRGINFPLPHEE